MTRVGETWAGIRAGSWAWIRTKTDYRATGKKRYCRRHSVHDSVHERDPGTPKLLKNLRDLWGDMIFVGKIWETNTLASPCDTKWQQLTQPAQRPVFNYLIIQHAVSRPETRKCRENTHPIAVEIVLTTSSQAVPLSPDSCPPRSIGVKHIPPAVDCIVPPTLASAGQVSRLSGV